MITWGLYRYNGARQTYGHDWPPIGNRTWRWHWKP